MRTAWRTLALLLACNLSRLPAVAAQPATVIFVRHAEKAAAPAADPGLTPTGAQRARDLAIALADAHVGTIITTQFQRTRATADPLAQAIGRAPVVVAATSDVRAHVDAVIAAVRSRPAGDVVLVVGHSNTLAPIISGLGGPQLPDLCDNQYATMTVLELPANAPPRLIRASYGVPDSPDAGACSHTMRQP